MHLVCCWPGLAELWCRGSTRALVAAVAFTWVTCLVLLATFVWPEWLGTWMTRLLWLAILATWLFSLARSHMGYAKLIGKSDKKAHEAFQKAQEEYLRGNWFDAEAILLELLEKYPRDAEATLLLIGVLRHTQRWQPALRRLETLQSLDTSAPWRFEILRERQILEKRFAESLVS